VRFLIDECLSVDLVTVAGESGHEAQHVAHVGRAGWKDWNVMRSASDGDFVLVTNNASDFRQLYAAQPLHAGLVILIPAVNRVVRQKLFPAALDELTVIGEPVNRVLELDLDGEEVTLTLYDRSSPSSRGWPTIGWIAWRTPYEPSMP
jgi:predicted nuclease of predicted toxin-antitoxin system